MKNRKFFLISLFFLLLCVSNSFGQGLPDVAPNHRWPVETGHVMPRNGRVPGTPSEYRTPYTGAANIFGDIVPAGTHRFHQGLDVSAAAPHPDNVYSIEPGTHTIDFESAGYNSRIRLGNRIYWHTTPLAGFMDNVTLINGNDHIGDMSSDHVHLQPTINTINGTQNYLVNLLPGYVDSEAPEIYNNWYYLNGHSKTNNSTVLSQTVTDANGLVRRVVYEKVDLVVQTRDDRVNYDGTGYGGNIGPNKLSYNIKNEDGNISYTGGEVLNVDFTTLAGHTTATNVFGFHANCCTPADFRYVLTSHLHTAPHDRFWNTRLRLGQIENWDVSSGRNPDLDARINLEAHFEDGVKTLEYTVRDLDGGGAATENESTTFDYIVIDNFRPFVQQIRIYQVLPDNPEYLVYSGNWEWIESIGELRFGTNTLGSGDPFNGFRGPAQEDYPLQVEITASEPMLSLQISGLTPHFNVGAPINLVNPVVPTSNNPSRHTFYFEIDLPGLLSNIPANHYGFYMLDIEGEDIAGNDLIGYTRDISTAPDVTTVTPPTFFDVDIPVKQTNGNFSNPTNSPNGTVDRVHGFLLEEVCTDGLTSGEDEEKSFTNCMDVDFTANQTTALVGVTGITFTPNVVGGTPPFNLLWDFDDGQTLTVNNVTNINSAVTSPVIYNTLGLKDVSLTITDSDNNMQSTGKSDFINVYNNSSPGILSAYFTTFPLAPVSGAATQFNEVVTGGVPPYNLTWNFGDGSSGSGSNTSHTYNSNGVYTVTLTVSDNQGSTSTYYETLVVEAPFNPQLVLNNVNHAARQATFTIQNLEIGQVYQMEWNFGDGTILTNNATLQSHTYSTSGVKTVSVKITKFGLNAQSVTLSETFDILDYITASFNCPTIALPQGGSHLFQNTSNIIGANPNDGVYEFKWEVTELATGTGSSTNWSTGLNYSHTFPNQGYYEVKLKVRLNKQGNICWGPYCRAETTCIVEVGPCTVQSYPLPFEPFIDHEYYVVPTLQGGTGCSSSKLAIGITETSITGSSSLDPNNYTWEFEAFRIKQNGKDKKTYTILTQGYPPNQCAVLFDYNEFNNDNGDEQYYLRVTVRENGCNKKITKDQLLCSLCNGGVFSGQIVPCPFNWEDDVLIQGASCSNDTEDFGDLRPAYPTTRMVTQTFVNRYLNKEAYLFNGINLENQGAIGIGGSDTISFQAGTEVRLKPGFEVTWGGRFAAVIGDEPNCYYGPNLPLTEDETEENTVLEDATRYQGPLTMHLYPNPADEKAEVLLNFKLPDAQDCTISILDLSGKMLHSTKVNGIAGNNLFMLPAELMNAGMYFVHLQTETDQITKKLVIQSSN